MAKKLSKKRQAIIDKIERDRNYSLREASALVKEITTTKFDASIDLDIRLGVDPRKANQMVRGTAALPHGTGKEKVILVLCNPEYEEQAKGAGADYVGLDEYLTKIQDGWTEFDVIITHPEIMPKLGRLGRILGPRGLMPNPKAGTVTTEIESTVKEVKAGKIDFKVDRYGIVHAAVARSSFTPEQIYENARELVQIIQRLKPSAAKGVYMKSVSMSSTMSPGIPIETKNIAAS